jgi:hypothetical protein
VARHSQAQYVELADSDLAKVLAEFQAMGDSVEKFEAFVNPVAVQATQL